MPVHQWELRADVRPLDEAAVRWSEIGQLMAQRADDLVGAARHALDGWEAAAAESYDDHRRRVVANLDRFTTLTDQVAGSLRAVSSMITETQKELDRAWVEVSLVPHQEVGPDRRLVFWEAGDEDRAKVSRSQLEADEIRRRLRGALDQESTRLRTARAELIQVRTTLVDLAGGAFPALLRSGVQESGVGIFGPASTSVRGSAESGVSAGMSPTLGLAPVAPISVSMPHLSGLATSGIAPIIGTAASGTAGRVGRAGSGTQAQGSGLPMGGGMAAGAGRGGSPLRGGGAGRRTGAGSLITPRLAGDDAQARAAGEKVTTNDTARA
ncbi:MAG: hypothetical protein LH477_13165, partial [Nocardioides sp.]|nr:hypothetical protein [Nocardioides sp.]